MVRKIINPIKYDIGKIVKLDQGTLKEFGISQSDYKNIHKYDHINQNKDLASKIKQQKFILRSFQRSVLNKSCDSNLQILRNKVEARQSLEREKKISNMNRWSDFKQKKDKVLEKYCFLIRKKLGVE